MPEPDAVVTLAGDVGDVITGLTLVAAGVATWTRARPSRTGQLLVLAGAAWLAGDVVGALVFAHRGPLVHALLTFPTGRTRSKPVMVVIAAAYVDGLLPAAAREPWSTLALMVAVLSVAAWRWSAATGVERRALLVPLVCAGLVGVPLTLSAIGRLTGTDTYVLATWTYEAAIVLTAWALAVDLLSSRSVRAAATGLIVDLADRQEPRALRDALSRSVGDPALVIAYRVDPEWVDEVGQPVTLPVPEDERTADGDLRGGRRIARGCARPRRRSPSRPHAGAVGRRCREVGARQCAAPGRGRRAHARRRCVAPTAHRGW